MVKDFIETDPIRISWSSSLVANLTGTVLGAFNEEKVTTCLYRPFTKQWAYYDGMFNHRVGQLPSPAYYPDFSLGK